MSSVFWVLMPAERVGNHWMSVFVGTRTTKASAIKLATKEMLSNRWNARGLATIYEVKYDGLGNWVDTIGYEVSRMGNIKSKSPVSAYHSDKDAFIHRLRKQYGVSNGQLVKRDIEPPMYSLVRWL